MIEVVLFSLLYRQRFVCKIYSVANYFKDVIPTKKHTIRSGLIEKKQICSHYSALRSIPVFEYHLGFGYDKPTSGATSVFLLMTLKRYTLGARFKSSTSLSWVSSKSKSSLDYPIPCVCLTIQNLYSVWWMGGGGISRYGTL